MADEQQPIENNEQPEQLDADIREGSDNHAVDDLPSWAQDMIRSLRDEAASRRVALKQHEAESRKREQQRLAEEGKWRELAESRADELSNLAPYRERAEKLESMLMDSNTQRIEQIPESMRTLIPSDYAPEQLARWLDANLSHLTRPTAPKLDGGTAGGGGNAITLTEDEKQVARATGISFEEYAKQKQRILGG